MPPTPPIVLSNAFYAFYDLLRPSYYAYAETCLAPEEAQVAVSHLFDLVAAHWTTIVSEPCPTAWAWNRHTRSVARRSGRTLTPAQDVSLLHDRLLLTTDQIATITGAETATITALLAAAHREGRPATRPARFATPAPRPTTHAMAFGRVSRPSSTGHSAPGCLVG